MKINIQARNVEISESFRAHVTRRLQFALGRFGRRIQRVAVKFGDTNGLRGGLDKLCCVDVYLRPSKRLRIEDLDSDLFAVIDRAAERTARTVARVLERELRIQRTPLNTGKGISKSCDGPSFASSGNQTLSD